MSCGFLLRGGWSALCALAVPCALLLPAGGAARGVRESASAAARGSRLMLGVLGDPSRFDSQTGQQSRVRLLIVGWGQGGTPAYFANLFSSMLEEPMLGVSTGPAGAGAVSPEQIARGEGDSFLVVINQALAQWGKPIFVRPFAEMNGYWNAYCAYNQNGSPRGPSYSTAAFRSAFARVYLILHGGPHVNSRLAQLGLPPASGQLATNPLVKVVWNPQGYGDPDLPGNSAQAYYPGDRYVDIVGDDLYDIRGKAAWPAAEALYQAHPGKPFAFPEWGLWNLDDPGFVTEMASFLHAHSRTVMAGYYSGSPGSIFDLASKPRSLDEYRQLISPTGQS